VLYYWEIVDAHQLLQSALQRLTSSVGAADGSAAPSTAVSNGGSRRMSRGRQGDDDNELRGRNATPLVASLDRLVATHASIAAERVKDRDRITQLEEKEGSQKDRKRKFDRLCELRDLGRQYRRERIQLDTKAENFVMLRDFYDEEIEMIETELGELDDKEVE
jgi:hypothetical protein